MEGVKVMVIIFYVPFFNTHQPAKDSFPLGTGHLKPNVNRRLHNNETVFCQ